MLTIPPTIPELASCPPGLFDKREKKIFTPHFFQNKNLCLLFYSAFVSFLSAPLLSSMFLSSNSFSMFLHCSITTSSPLVICIYNIGSTDSTDQTLYLLLTYKCSFNTYSLLFYKYISSTEKHTYSFPFCEPSRLPKPVLLQLHSLYYFTYVNQAITQKCSLLSYIFIMIISLHATTGSKAPVSSPQPRH